MLMIVISCLLPLHLIVFADETASPVRIAADALGDHVSIHSELQEQYLNGPLQDIASYADGTQELSRPAKITLTWNTEIDEAYAAENGISTEGCNYTLYFGKTEDFPMQRPIPPPRRLIRSRIWSFLLPTTGRSRLRSAANIMRARPRPLRPSATARETSMSAGLPTCAISAAIRR